MFRLGDFYELFYEDAVTAARELEITLTSRNKEKGQAIPMCGVPYHAAEGYIARLIQRGYRVAICDQMEDPRFAKKLVKREITRVVTPGTATDSALLRSRENNYLAALAAGGDRAGLAHVDVSTGEFRATELDAAEAAAALEQLGRARGAGGRRPARPLAGAGLGAAAHRGRCLGLRLRLRRAHAARALPPADAGRLRAGGPRPGRRRGGRHPALPQGHAEGRRSIIWSGPPSYDRAEAMVLDAVTVRNLELVEPLFTADAGAKDSTLVSVIDQTADRHGRAPAAAPAAAAVARSGRDRRAAGRRRGAVQRHHPARRSRARCSARCWTWSACWPR